MQRHELRTYIDACKPGLDLHYWRSKSQFEVDFILGALAGVSGTAVVRRLR